MHAPVETLPLAQSCASSSAYSGRRSSLTSLKSFNLRLWDEQMKKLVSFRHLRDLKRQKKQADKLATERGESKTT